MARSWGFLVAILALGCHTTRIFAAAEGLAGPEIVGENEVLSSSVDMGAREQCSSGYTWCASLVVVLTLAALAWATRGKPPDSRRDEHETRLLESQDQLRRAREEMKAAEKAQNNLVTEVVWWQGLHMDVLNEKRGLRKELRQFREEIEPGLLSEIDRKEKLLVTLKGSRLDTIIHPCTTCFPPAGGDEVGSGGGGSNDGRGGDVESNGGAGSDYSKEAGDDDGYGSRGGGPRRGEVNKESGMGTRRSGQLSGRQAGHNHGEELEQFVRPLSPLSAARAPTQSEGRGDGGETEGSRDGAGMSTIKHIKQDGNETVARHIRPLPPSLHVHTEDRRLSVGGDAVGDLGDADMTGNEPGEPNDTEMLGPLTLPLPLSPEPVVRTEEGMDGKGHEGGVPGAIVGPDSQRLQSASGTVSSCSPLTSLGEASVTQYIDVGQEEEKQEEKKRPEPSTCLDGKRADTGGATARDHNAGKRWCKSTAAGWRQPYVPEGVEDLAWAPPVNPQLTFALPPQTKTHTGINHAGSHLTPSAGRTTEAAAVQILTGRQRITGGGHVEGPFSVNAPLTSGTPAEGSQLKVGGVNQPAFTAKEAAETAAPAANVLAPPFSAGSGSDKADEREYAFGRRFSSRGGRSEEQPSLSTFIFERIGASETSPATEVATPKVATASSGVAMATVFSVGCAGKREDRDRELAPHASEPSYFPFRAGPDCISAAMANVPEVDALAGNEGIDAGGRSPYVFGRGVASGCAGSKQEPGSPMFTFCAPNATSGTVPVAAVTAGMVSATSMGAAVNGEGKGEGRVPHACESSRLPFGVAASSALADDEVARMPASTAAPVPTAETKKSKASAARLPIVGPGRPSQLAPGLRGLKVTFAASADTDTIGSTIAAPKVPPIAKSTGTAIREGVKYVVRGRRVSSGEASVHAMAVRFRAIQDRSERLAEIDHQIMKNERFWYPGHPLFRDHDVDRKTNVDDTTDVDGEVKHDVDGEGKGGGGSDDGCSVQGLCMGFTGKKGIPLAFAEPVSSDEEVQGLKLREAWLTVPIDVGTFKKPSRANSPNTSPSKAYPTSAIDC